MPRKSKDPEEGACPRCRKLVPLTPTRGGSFVLRTHHVVVAVEHYSGHEVEECAGSGGEPATLDDSEDWAWVAEEAAPVSLGAAIREAAAEIIAANRETVVTDIRDEEHALTTEQMADVARASINGAAVRAGMTASMVPRALRPSRVEVNGVDITNAIASIQINEAPRDVTSIYARVLLEVRQAYIDVTGTPPEDADMSLEEPTFTNDLRTLTLRLRAPSGELQVSTAISPSVVGEPGYAEEVARSVGAKVRRELRGRIPEPGAGP